MTSRALLAVVTLFLAACTVAPKPDGNGSAMVAPDSMESVVKRTFTTYGFRLQSGKTLPERTLPVARYARPGAMGPADRPRQGDRHEQVLRGLQQRARVVVWVDRAGQHQSGDGQALRAGLPRDLDARHRDGAANTVARDRRAPSRRGRRPVVRRLPGLPVVGIVSGV